MNTTPWELDEGLPAEIEEDGGGRMGTQIGE
jgi:hypothetical protein